MLLTLTLNASVSVKRLGPSGGNKEGVKGHATSGEGAYHTGKYHPIRVCYIILLS